MPVRAGSGIAFLGAIINYVLASEKHFRDYVVAYTNAATILTEDFADTEDLDGVFSGLDREHRTYDFHTWQYEGLEMQAASGERDKEYQDRAATREAARGEAHGSGGAGLPSGTPERGRDTAAPAVRLPGRSVLPVPGQPGRQCSSARRGQHRGACPVTAARARRACRLITQTRDSRSESRPYARRSGGSAADAKVELDRQVSLAECVPGVGEGFGFDALMQGVQVG